MNNNINQPNKTHDIFEEETRKYQNPITPLVHDQNYNYETIKTIEHLMTLASAIEIISIIISVILGISLISISIDFIIFAGLIVLTVMLIGHIYSNQVKAKALLLHQTYEINQNLFFAFEKKK